MNALGVPFTEKYRTPSLILISNKIYLGGYNYIETIHLSEIQI